MGILLGAATTSLVVMREYKTVDERVNGYRFIFITGTTLATIAFLYIICFMKDTYKQGKHIWG